MPCLVCESPVFLAMSEEQLLNETQTESAQKTFPIYGYSKIKKTSTRTQAQQDGVRTWKVKVANEGIPLNSEVLDVLQWQEDDVIEWKVTEEGFLSFTRVKK